VVAPLRLVGKFVVAIHAVKLLRACLKVVLNRPGVARACTLGLALIRVLVQETTAYLTTKVGARSRGFGVSAV
jgi:hypothetical protein